MRFREYEIGSIGCEGDCFGENKVVNRGRLGSCYNGRGL